MKPPPRPAAVAQRQPPKMTPETIDKLIILIQQGWNCSILVIKDKKREVEYGVVQPLKPAG